MHLERSIREKLAYTLGLPGVLRLPGMSVPERRSLRLGTKAAQEGVLQPTPTPAPAVSGTQWGGEEPGHLDA